MKTAAELLTKHHTKLEQQDFAQKEILHITENKVLVGGKKIMNTLCPFLERMRNVAQIV